MKKLLAISLVVLMALGMLAGCAKKAEEPAPAAEPVHKVALLLPGSANDNGWNAYALSGLKMIEEKYGVEIAYTESVPSSDYEQTFRNYAAAGFDVIFGHGYEFGDPAVAVAGDYPDVKFVISSTNISGGTNVGSINTLPSDNGIMQGIAAAYMTKTGKIGAVGGADYPSITDPLNNFAAGALSVNPELDVKLLLTYSFTDAALAKEYTLNLIEEGCDVIMFNLDESVYGFVQAIEEANAAGKFVWVIPSIYDQNDMLPQNAIMSGVTDVPKAMLDVYDKIREGTWEPKFYSYGAATGCVYYTPNDALWSNMPEEGKTALSDMLAKLSSGEVDSYKFMDEYLPADLKLN